MDKSPQPKKETGHQRGHWRAEQVMLLVGVGGFLGFIWLIAFFFVPLIRSNSRTVVNHVTLVVVTPTAKFILPPTWTPGPTEVFIPTPLGTGVVSGVPTRIYTPRPTSLPGLPLPNLVRPSSIEVIDLARILQGESPGDKDAAYLVGWVAKNRLLHRRYGDTYAEVSSGFFGYLPGVEPRPEFKELARRIIRAREDPTGGSLYALSRTDITTLGIPPARADVALGEWFFFRTWPIDAR